MEFHHHSLDVFEAWQRKEDQAEHEALQHRRPSFFVRTPDWEEYADTEEERNSLYNDAILCGFDPSQVTIETMPF
tara:strand:- start:51 stop:275 length:225 start_codon:yes stop_codon:yes gene_type:complete